MRNYNPDMDDFSLAFLRQNQIPFLDVINNAGSLELKVVGDSQKSQRIEYKSDYGPWAILTSDTGKNDWSFPISNSNQRRLFRVVESVRPRIFNHSSFNPNPSLCSQLAH